MTIRHFTEEAGLRFYMRKSQRSTLIWIDQVLCNA